MAPLLFKTSSLPFSRHGGAGFWITTNVDVDVDVGVNVDVNVGVGVDVDVDVGERHLLLLPQPFPRQVSPLPGQGRLAVPCYDVHSQIHDFHRAD